MVRCFFVAKKLNAADVCSCSSSVKRRRPGVLVRPLLGASRLGNMESAGAGRSPVDLAAVLDKVSEVLDAQLCNASSTWSPIWVRTSPRPHGPNTVASLSRTHDELEQRLRQTQAKRGQLSCSIMWNTQCNIGLVCSLPSGAKIFFGSRTAGGGNMDVGNQNRFLSEATATPVENIYFAQPELGRYQFEVRCYNLRTKRGQRNTVCARLCKSGCFEDKVVQSLGQGELKLLFSTQWNAADVARSNLRSKASATDVVSVTRHAHSQYKTALCRAINTVNGLLQKECDAGSHLVKFSNEWLPEIRPAELTGLHRDRVSAAVRAELRTAAENATDAILEIVQDRLTRPALRPSHSSTANAQHAAPLLSEPSARNEVNVDHNGKEMAASAANHVSRGRKESSTMDSRPEDAEQMAQRNRGEAISGGLNNAAATHTASPPKQVRASPSQQSRGAGAGTSQCERPSPKLTDRDEPSSKPIGRDQNDKVHTTRRASHETSEPSEKHVRRDHNTDCRRVDSEHMAQGDQACTSTGGLIKAAETRNASPRKQVVASPSRQRKAASAGTVQRGSTTHAHGATTQSAALHSCKPHNAEAQCQKRPSTESTGLNQNDAKEHSGKSSSQSASHEASASAAKRAGRGHRGYEGRDHSDPKVHHENSSLSTFRQRTSASARKPASRDKRHHGSGDSKRVGAEQTLPRAQAKVGAGKSTTTTATHNTSALTHVHVSPNNQHEAAGDAAPRHGSTLHRSAHSAPHNNAHPQRSSTQRAELLAGEPHHGVAQGHNRTPSTPAGLVQNAAKDHHDKSSSQSASHEASASAAKRAGRGYRSDEGRDHSDPEIHDENSSLSTFRKRTSASARKPASRDKRHHGSGDSKRVVAEQTSPRDQATVGAGKSTTTTATHNTSALTHVHVSPNNQHEAAGDAAPRHGSTLHRSAHSAPHNNAHPQRSSTQRAELLAGEPHHGVAQGHNRTPSTPAGLVQNAAKDHHDKSSSQSASHEASASAAKRAGRGYRSDEGRDHSDPEIHDENSSLSTFRKRTSASARKPASRDKRHHGSGDSKRVVAEQTSPRDQATVGAGKSTTTTATHNTSALTHVHVSPNNQHEAAGDTAPRHGSTLHGSTHSAPHNNAHPQRSSTQRAELQAGEPHHGVAQGHTRTSSTPAGLDQNAAKDHHDKSSSQSASHEASASAAKRAGRDYSSSKSTGRDQNDHHKSVSQSASREASASAANHVQRVDQSDRTMAEHIAERSPSERMATHAQTMATRRAAGGIILNAEEPPAARSLNSNKSREEGVALPTHATYPRAVARLLRRIGDYEATFQLEFENKVVRPLMAAAARETTWHLCDFGHRCPTVRRCAYPATKTILFADQPVEVLDRFFATNIEQLLWKAVMRLVVEHVSTIMRRVSGAVWNLSEDVNSELRTHFPDAQRQLAHLQPHVYGNGAGVSLFNLAHHTDLTLLKCIFNDSKMSFFGDSYPFRGHYRVSNRTFASFVAQRFKAVMQHTVMQLLKLIQHDVVAGVLDSLRNYVEAVGRNLTLHKDGVSRHLSNVAEPGHTSTRGRCPAQPHGAHGSSKKIATSVAAGAHHRGLRPNSAPEHTTNADLSVRDIRTATETITSVTTRPATSTAETSAELWSLVARFEQEMHRLVRDVECRLNDWAERQTNWYLRLQPGNYVTIQQLGPSELYQPSFIHHGQRPRDFYAFLAKNFELLLLKHVQAAVNDPVTMAAKAIYTAALAVDEATMRLLNERWPDEERLLHQRRPRIAPRGSASAMYDLKSNAAPQLLQRVFTLPTCRIFAPELVSSCVWSEHVVNATFAKFVRHRLQEVVKCVVVEVSRHFRDAAKQYADSMRTFVTAVAQTHHSKQAGGSKTAAVVGASPSARNVTTSHTAASEEAASQRPRSSAIGARARPASEQREPSAAVPTSGILLKDSIAGLKSQADEILGNVRNTIRLMLDKWEFDQSKWSILFFTVHGSVRCSVVTPANTHLPTAAVITLYDTAATIRTSLEAHVTPVILAELQRTLTSIDKRTMEPLCTKLLATLPVRLQSDRGLPEIRWSQHTKQLHHMLQKSFRLPRDFPDAPDIRVRAFAGAVKQAVSDAKPGIVDLLVDEWETVLTEYIDSLAMYLGGP